MNQFILIQLMSNYLIKFSESWMFSPIWSLRKYGCVNHAYLPVIHWTHILDIKCLRFLVTNIWWWSFVSPVVWLCVVCKVIDFLLQWHPSMGVNWACSMEWLWLIVFHPIKSSLLVSMTVCFCVPSCLIPKLGINLIATCIINFFVGFFHFWIKMLLTLFKTRIRCWLWPTVRSFNGITSGRAPLFIDAGMGTMISFLTIFYGKRWPCLIKIGLVFINSLILITGSFLRALIFFLEAAPCGISKGASYNWVTMFGWDMAFISWYSVSFYTNRFLQ